MSAGAEDKKEYKHSQIYPDNINTPSLIQTLLSVLEFHQFSA